LQNLPDIFIIDECEDGRIRRAMPRFDPTQWDIEGIIRHGRGHGRNAYRLMTAWTIACQAAMRALVDEVGSDSVSWTVGWYFGTPGDDWAHAVHKQTSSGHVLALCPVDRTGRQAYATSSREDMMRLIALSRHEAAHAVHRWHSEDYARLLTAIDARMDDAHIMGRIRSF
jgi:hypothetical protein